MTNYFMPFIISFLLSVALIFLVLHAAKKLKWEGRSSERHIHKKGAYRVGGIAMIIAFNLAIFLNRDLVITPELAGIMLASVIILFVGLRDDIKELFWKTQFFSQIAVAILVFISGVRIYYITNPISGGIINLDSSLGVIFSVFLVIAWIILIINSMNWLDGIDGLSGGIFLIGSITIFLLSLRPEVNQPAVAILSMIAAGIVMGFLIFNFNPSRILAGTSGSMFMGFFLSALAIFAGTKIATAMLVMSIPIIDFLWVIGERIRNKKSIFKADKNHIHFKLIELGWSQKKVALYFYGFTILMAVIALNTRVIGKSVTLAAAVAAMGLALIFINKKIRRIRQSK